MHWKNRGNNFFLLSCVIHTCTVVCFSWPMVPEHSIVMLHSKYASLITAIVAMMIVIGGVGTLRLRTAVRVEFQRRLCTCFLRNSAVTAVRNKQLYRDLSSRRLWYKCVRVSLTHADPEALLVVTVNDQRMDYARTAHYLGVILWHTQIGHTDFRSGKQSPKLSRWRPPISRDWLHGLCCVITGTHSQSEKSAPRIQLA